jgi:hypothetical protein
MAGYSGKPLAEKLGLKPGQRVGLLNAPIGYAAMVGPVLKQVELVDPVRNPISFLHIFVMTAADARRQIKKARTLVAEDGTIWISWPKKASGWKTDVTEDTIRNAALSNDLVDVKVCAVDDTWSGLKLVIPVASRAKKTRAAGANRS